MQCLRSPVAASQLPGVCGVSDLHVWALKPGIPLLAAHVVLADGADGDAVLEAATSYCRSAGIECALGTS